MEFKDLISIAIQVICSSEDVNLLRLTSDVIKDEM